MLKACAFALKQAVVVEGASCSGGAGASGQRPARRRPWAQKGERQATSGLHAASVQWCESILSLLCCLSVARTSKMLIEGEEMKRVWWNGVKVECWSCGARHEASLLTTSSQRTTLGRLTSTGIGSLSRHSKQKEVGVLAHGHATWLECLVRVSQPSPSQPKASLT